ncbi:MAG: ABC transporter substrate-binding protein [Cyclobacteriaceae bacterium]|jgi:tetratricopeptide (TPR) repeat protein|nr:ABC transporter substrate-binding protein [Cyclobacteriaceae bacterium]
MMKHHFFKRIVFCSWLFFQLGLSGAIAQGNFQQQYANAKGLFREGKYNLAMESFKPLIAYDRNNPFSEHAAYYYAISAYRQGYRSVAKDMFTQIRQLYPTWDQLPEVNLWLAQIHFESGEYFQGIYQLDQISDPARQAYAREMKRSSLSSVEDIETLKYLHAERPKDEIVGERLAAVLAAKGDKPEDRSLLEKLIVDFRLNRDDYIERAPETVHKKVYSVSLLFPFLVKSLEPTPARKRNQFVLDLYEGMKLAVDTLAKQGISISLRAYDTERSTARIKNILEYNEIMNTDLIVGPLFPEENKLIQDFSKQHQINLFNPVSNNFDLVRDNPYGFLFMPSLETLGEESARLMDKQLTNKKCLVFMGDTRRDSTLAMSFVRGAQGTGIKILNVERFTKESSGRVLNILATPTEYDEFRYPKQFTLPKDSLGCVFVASDDPLIYAKVINGVTTRGDKVTVIGSENWLDQTTDYEKFQALDIMLFAPTFTAPDDPDNRAFQANFIKAHGRVSSNSPYQNYVKVGYEFMLFAGTMLKKYGVYFQDGMSRSTQSGFLMPGYDFRNSRSNRNVTFIRVVEGQLVPFMHR